MKYLSFLASLIFLQTLAQDPAPIECGNNPSVGTYASVNGINMYYERYGKGEPILLLHGGIGSISGFQHLIPTLSQDFEVFAVDFRGHGRTNNNLDSMSYELHTADIVKFIDYLGLEKVKILGYSDGGVVALKLAAKAPDKIEKMVVVGANKSVQDLKNYIVDFAQTMTSKDNLSDPYIKEQQEWYAHTNPEPEKYHRFMQLVGQMWLTDPYINEKEYAMINTPLLMIYGDNDCVHFDNMIEMYNSLNCEKKHLCILPNTNHFVFAQKHAAIINPIILRYLVAGK